MGRAAAVAWSETERAAWRPTERITVSEWCDRSVVLDAQYAAEAGPFRTARTPYSREILDSFGLARVDRITLMMGTQVGKTQTWLNMLAFGVAQKPAPAMLVMPGEEDAKQMLGGRLKALFEASPELGAHLTGRSNDWRDGFVQFDLSVIYAAWANSPRALAGRPVCYVFFDEVDKFPPWSGREADPISLGEERTRTYKSSRRAKVVLCSTPTTRNGYIFREYEQSDQRRYFVPCPFCGKFQTLEFRGIKFDGARDPRQIRAEGRLTYQCSGCEKRITDEHKPKMLQLGVWVPQGAEVRADGTLANLPRPNPHRGYRLNALYSPWLTFSEIAAKFLEANESGAAKLMNFNNSWLAEPFEEKAEETKPETLAALAEDYDAGLVPKDVLVLTAGADVQKDAIYYTIRGWGANERSWLIQAGRVDTWQALENLVMLASYRRVLDGDTLQVRLALIDSQGHRTDQVDAWASRWTDRVRTIAGRRAAKVGTVSPFWAMPNERDFEGRPVGGKRWFVDTTYFKNKLHRLQHTQPADPGRWALHRNPSEAYLSQVSNEHRVLEVNKKTGQQSYVWKERPGSGRQTHWWDCEVYALAAAEMLGLRGLSDPLHEVEEAQAAGRGLDEIERMPRANTGGRPSRRVFGR